MADTNESSMSETSDEAVDYGSLIFFKTVFTFIIYISLVLKFTTLSHLLNFTQSWHNHCNFYIGRLHLCTQMNLGKHEKFALHLHILHC